MFPLQVHSCDTESVLVFCVSTSGAFLRHGVSTCILCFHFRCILATRSQYLYFVFPLQVHSCDTESVLVFCVSTSGAFLRHGVSTCILCFHFRCILATRSQYLYFVFPLQVHSCNTESVLVFCVSTSGAFLRHGVSTCILCFHFRCILATRSQYFSAMFGGSWTESDKHCIKLEGFVSVHCTTLNLT